MQQPHDPPLNPFIPPDLIQKNRSCIKNTPNQWIQIVYGRNPSVNANILYFNISKPNIGAVQSFIGLPLSTLGRYNDFIQTSNVDFVFPVGTWSICGTKRSFYDCPGSEGKNLRLVEPNGTVALD